MLEVKELVGQVVDALRKQVAGAIGPVIARLETIERALADRPAPERGEPGQNGDPGERGDIGQKGDPGDPGAQGEPGEAGTKGDAGERGEKGDPGPQGERGEPGPAGEKGDRGNVGPAGDVGPPGEKGEKGDLGLQGKAGDPGAIGERGPAGEKGERGLDGRDAALIEPMPAIDETRSYAKGTWAKHRGGLWVSRQVTQGMVGWDCIVDGVADINIVQGEDMRSLSLSVERSSGEVVRKEWTTPVVIYRGIFREDEAYGIGDSTTRGGSTWVLVDEQKGKPGEEGSGWQLAAKCGRDGRDGLKGEKGERGAEGKSGRDLTQMDSNGRKF